MVSWVTTRSAVRVFPSGAPAPTPAPTPPAVLARVVPEGFRSRRHAAADHAAAGRLAVVSDHQETPAPLVVTASLVALEGLALLGIAVVELADLTGDRVSLGISVAVFFIAYGVLLLVAGLALVRRTPWARGPALMSQLIALGVAWYLRDAALPAAVVAVTAVVAIAGIVHPASIEALESEAG